MNESHIIFSLLTIVGLFYLLIKEHRKYKIYYSNYHNCLKALAEHDPKLAEYLESKHDSRDN